MVVRLHQVHASNHTEGPMSNRAIDEFAEGLVILAKYDTNGSGVQPEHDKLFVTVSAPPSKEDGETLERLGWSPEDGDLCWWSKSS